MAIRVFDKYSPRANAPDTDYPDGSIKNESVPGANDGTPLDQDWGNDWEGFKQSALADGGVTPNGTPDSTSNPQILDAIKASVRNDAPTYTDLVFDSVADAVTAVTNGSVTLNSKLRVEDYYGGPAPSNSGVLFFKVVAGGTGVDDGGKYINAGSFQLEQNLKKPYNASSWGQVGDGVNDDTAAINAAIIYARNSGKLVINGTSRITSPITFGPSDRGLFIIGDGSQTYGEFNTGKPTTLLFSGLTAGEFCITLNNIFPFRIDGINIESDSWDVNGIKTIAPTRELILNDVSIKGVGVGLETHDTFVVRAESLGITARTKGISWGGGTTLQLENLKLQGDKAGGVRLDRGVEFVFDAGQNDSPVMPNVRISGFCQFSNTVIYTDNSSCQVELDSFDVEDNAFAVLWIRNQFKGFYRIKNSALLLNDGSNAIVIGPGNQYVSVDIGDSLMSDKHLITKDWTTEKFINTETGVIGSNIELLMTELNFSRVKTGIVDAAIPRVKVTRAPFTRDPDCIMQTGSGTLPEDIVLSLWRNKQLYDATNDVTTYYGNKGSEFSNGMIYKVTSQDFTGNTPIVAYFTLRTVDGSQYFNKTDVIGTVPISYDSVNDELVFTASSSNQRFIITCG